MGYLAESTFPFSHAEPMQWSRIRQGQMPHPSVNAGHATGAEGSMSGPYERE